VDIAITVLLSGFCMSFVSIFLVFLWSFVDDIRKMNKGQKTDYDFDEDVENTIRRGSKAFLIVWIPLTALMTWGVLATPMPKPL
jgi:hypothetical protein